MKSILQAPAPQTHEPLTTGRLARQVDVNPETIRYYERAGLLEAPYRLASGYRIFPADSIARIRFIKRAQKLGFSLEEIKELLAMRAGRTGRECAQVKELAAHKIAEIDSKVQALLAMRGILEHLEAECPGSGPLSRCPIVASLQDPELAPARKAKRQEHKRK